MRAISTPTTTSLLKGTTSFQSREVIFLILTEGIEMCKPKVERKSPEGLIDSNPNTLVQY